MQSSAQTEINQVLRHYKIGRLQNAQHLARGYVNENWIIDTTAVYNLTLQRLGVLPHEAVFIDDTAGHVEAAQKLGIHGIIFTNALALKRELKHFLLTSNSK